MQLAPNNVGRDVAWITDKAGCVAMDALTHSPANAGIPVCPGRKLDTMYPQTDLEYLNWSQM